MHHLATFSFAILVGAVSALAPSTSLAQGYGAPHTVFGPLWQHPIHAVSQHLVNHPQPVLTWSDQPIDFPKIEPEMIMGSAQNPTHANGFNSQTLVQRYQNHTAYLNAILELEKTMIGRPIVFKGEGSIQWARPHQQTTLVSHGALISGILTDVSIKENQIHYQLRAWLHQDGSRTPAEIKLPLGQNPDLQSWLKSKRQWGIDCNGVYSPGPNSL